MKIRVYRRIRNNAYEVLIATTEWAQSDINLFREFGEPEIDVGVDNHPRFAKVMTQFPVRCVFSSHDQDSNDLSADGDCNSNDSRSAEDQAMEWKNNVVGKIKNAVEAHRQLKDDFSGEEIHMI